MAGAGRGAEKQYREGKRASAFVSEALFADNVGEASLLSQCPSKSFLCLQVLLSLKHELPPSTRCHLQFPALSQGCLPSLLLLITLLRSHSLSYSSCFARGLGTVIRAHRAPQAELALHLPKPEAPLGLRLAAASCPRALRMDSDGCSLLPQPRGRHSLHVAP